MALDVAGCRPRGDRPGPVTRSLPGVRGWWPFMRYIGHKIYSALILKQVIAGSLTAKLLGSLPLDACFGCLGPACVDGIWPICAAGTGGGKAGVPHPGPYRHVRLRRAFPDPEASRFKAGLSPPHGVRKAGPGKANPLSTKPAAGQGGQPGAGGHWASGWGRACHGWREHGTADFVFRTIRAARWPVTRATERRPCHGSAWLDAQLRPSCHPARIERVRRHGRSARSASPMDRLPVFIAQIRQAKRFHSAPLRPKASKGHSPGSGPAGPQNPVRSE